MLSFKSKNISFTCVLAAAVFIHSQFHCVQFYTFDASEDSLWFFFFLFSPTPTFPFHSSVLIAWSGGEQTLSVPSNHFERLLVLFCKGSCPHLTFSVITQLFAVFADGTSFYSPPPLPQAANLGRLPGACSFSKVLLLVTYFLLNTTCNCIFMWNSTVPLQAACVGVYANDRTRNEPLVGLGVLGHVFLSRF